MTASLPALQRNILRSRYFLDIHHDATQQAGRGRPAARYLELPRAAVVFAIGALDSYLSEVSSEVMVSQMEHGHLSGQSRRVLGAVAKSFPTLPLEVALVDDPAARMDVARDAIVTHFHENVAQHGSKAVVETLNRFGSSPNRLWDELSVEGWPNASADLDHWTAVRHAVVHRGEKARVLRAQGEFCSDLVEAIAFAVDNQAAEALAALKQP